mgnify:CR=1 FL=1
MEQIGGWSVVLDHSELQLIPTHLASRSHTTMYMYVIIIVFATIGTAFRSFFHFLEI